MNFILSVILALSLSACTTRPMRSDRQGLLEKGSSRTSIDHSKVVMNDDHGEEIKLTGVWQWPLKSVSISSEYGNRGNKFHQGIDLRAPMKTPVFAASDGVVVYVGTKIRGYGRMIVLKHPENFYSVYAHHSKNLVKVGKVIKRGDKIALSGKSGRSSGPHLHFEIRKGTESYNPAYALRENVQKFTASRSVAGETVQ